MKKKLFQKIARQLNAVIARRNLYLASPQGNRRVINAHVVTQGADFALVVQDLHDENLLHPVGGAVLGDGYGQSVDIDWTSGAVC